MISKLFRFGLLLGATAIILLLLACGGGGSSTPPNNNPQNGSLNIVISDDASEDWATIGIKVLSVALNPQNGGTPVTVYTAPSPVPVFNLVQLDQLGEILDNAQAPPGTYTSATLTLSANPGDVTLVVSADPEPGFAGKPGTAIPSNQIQIVGAQGAAGSLTIPLKVNFSSPITINAGQNNNLDLEFNLAHPAFIVAHPQASPGTTLWAVNFIPAFRNHPIDDITRLVLRHLYGTVSSVAADSSSITVMRAFPVEPPTNPETAITSSQSLKILADSSNGTTFFDMDLRTTTVIKNFSAQAGTLPNKFVRVAARVQADGSLVAVRMWAGSTFQNVFHPEGLVLHVNTTTNVLTVTDETGAAVPITVNASTQFFFRTPTNAAADATPIGTGTAFLSNLVRGFKVHVGVVDPLATPLVAQTVDIETATFGGSISSATPTGFTYKRTFNTTSDNYTLTLNFVASGTPNGKDANGNPISGFKWWNLTFPDQVDSGTNAISDFSAATGGTVNFGGAVAPIQPFGRSYTVWNNPANPQHFSTLWTIVVPEQFPLATVAANWLTTANGGAFGIIVPGGGATPVTVNVSSISASATLIFQVDRTNNLITISQQDITTTAGLNNVVTNLVSPTPVRVFGVPQSDGSIKAFVVFFFTGTKPAS